MKIAVGMSGGVDSSVTAFLLQQAGHEVIGTIMKIWDHGCTPGASRSKHSCYGPDEELDIKDASTVCSFLGIPLHVIDCAKQYKSTVLDYFNNEYCTGRTPNPCVICNQSIKFGILPSLLEKSGIAFDYFATGHYARVARDTPTGRFHLKKAADPLKDQTYFLYRLTQTQLSRTLFPLGEYEKTDVRKMAADAGLPVHDKEESQDFYSGAYADLIHPKENGNGAIVDINGIRVGTHAGIWNYTVGQRKGLGVFQKNPLYVVSINAQKNEIVVGEKELLYSKGLRATELNIIAATLPRRVSVKIRSNSREVPAAVVSENEKEIVVTFDQPQFAVTPGQSVVIYDNEIVVGGGVITEALPDTP